ncbi:ABC transporter permease subunit [Sporosarcina sp. YIM B06819]|uniref:ABC transporter permease subunit n=1 Tax=Sporosarcina sp. YIM B06819 TaxID=3081769 RepID=UPI00298C524B|nr:ABC transporter permease subunit [Sporosarcina sp. YIM B06819]
MNIVRREWKANTKSLLMWCIGVVAMVGGGMGKYAGLGNTGDSLNELMAQMPASLQAIMGTGSLDLTTIDGYYGVLYLYLLVMMSIHAAILGATIVSKEERDKTAEFLFVKPVSRARVISAKLATSVVIVFILNGVTLLSSILFVNLFNEGKSITTIIVLLMGGMWVLQLLFLFLGTAAAAVMKNPKLSIATSTGILLLTFILSVAIDLTDSLEGFKYVTPFKYFEAKNILSDGGYDIAFVGLSVLLMVVFITITYMYYRKRDLYV